LKKANITIHALTSQLHVARDAVTEFTCNLLDSAGQKRIILAIDEALSNIIIHGYKNDSSGEITIDMQSDGPELKFIISDNAPSFNPLELPPPDIDNYLESGQTGGLGIDIYKRIMDVSYERKETGGNRLIMVTTAEKKSSGIQHS